MDFNVPPSAEDHLKIRDRQTDGDRNKDKERHRETENDSERRRERNRSTGKEIPTSGSNTKKVSESHTPSNTFSCSLNTLSFIIICLKWMNEGQNVVNTTVVIKSSLTLKGVILNLLTCKSLDVFQQKMDWT